MTWYVSQNNRTGGLVIEQDEGQPPPRNSGRPMDASALAAHCRCFNNGPVWGLSVSGQNRSATVQALTIVASSGLRVGASVRVVDEDLTMPVHRHLLETISRFTARGAVILMATSDRRDAIDLRVECARRGFKPCEDWMRWCVPGLGRLPDPPESVPEAKRRQAR